MRRQTDLPDTCAFAELMRELKTADEALDRAGREMEARLLDGENDSLAAALARTYVHVRRQRGRCLARIDEWLALQSYAR